jgi:hypothetical protein
MEILYGINDDESGWTFSRKGTSRNNYVTKILIEKHEEET